MAWELHDLTADPTQCRDLAVEHPEIVRDLERLWYVEAGRNNAFPVNSHVENGRAPRPDTARTVYTCWGGASMIPNDAAPRTIQRPFTFDAHFTMSEGGAEGVLIAQGGQSGGWTLFVKDGQVDYDHNYLGLSRYRTAAGRLAHGAHAATLEIVLGEPFEISPSLTAMDAAGLGGRAMLTVDGGDPVELELRRMIPFNYSLTGEGLCCGHDSETAVSEAPHAPFAFTGEIGQVVVTVSGDEPLNDRMEAERATHAEQGYPGHPRERPAPGPGGGAFAFASALQRGITRAAPRRAPATRGTPRR